MALTTETAIRKVLSTSLTSEQVEAFIEDAALWVSEELADAEFTDQRLEIIERYLACALIRMRDLGLKSATFKEISETYQVDLYVTEYLTRAASFDTTGKLRRHFIDADNTYAVQFRVGAGFRDDPQVGT